MSLSRKDFKHTGLANVHFGGSDPSIPSGSQGRCQRITDSIEAATKPDDLNIPGNGYIQAGAVHSVDVNGRNRISYQWNSGHGDKIDFI